jgi:HPt (histidine-containing phosphotransfer) domain-containing protein
VPDPVNLTRLHEFADGTSDGVERLARLFLEDTRESMAELAAAHAGGDAVALRRLAHRFGGTCAACGADALAALLFDLESLAPDRAAPPSLLEAIARAHDEAAGFLTDFLEAQPRS